MQYTITILALLVSSAAAASITPNITKIHAGGRLVGAAKPAELPYPIVPMIWEGKLSNGNNVSISGTIEKVAVELEKIEPGIMAARAVAVAKRSFNVPRTPIWGRCWPEGDETWVYAYTDRPFGVRPVEDAIRHLKTTGGYCGAPAKSCVRISCSWDTAVYLCNDNPYYIAPHCYEMVQWISNTCETNAVFCCPSSIERAVGGKRGDSQGYTISLQEDNC